MSADPVQTHLEVPRGTGRSLAWWGVVTLVMTEGMLFALLLFVYYYLYALAPEWPLGDIEPPELSVVSIRTVLLFLSSATMSLADRAMRRGRLGLTKLGMALTFLLGAVFLAGHVEEMLRLPEEYTWATNAYGSLFYVIVNFHGAHLTVGLLFLAFSWVALSRGRYTAEHHEGLKVTGIYWHFVDVVWVFVFPTLYLLPHFVHGTL
ncbi:MAG: cytochrome c oxidase subunit 3 [Actinomycetota bacterium]|nr:cytochrome c oxidase subunit 3 [Actinomycetota bacterium]